MSPQACNGDELEGGGAAIGEMAGTVPGTKQLHLGRLWLLCWLVRLVGVAIAVAFASSYIVATDTNASYYPIARSLAAGHGYALDGKFAEATRIPPLFPFWLAPFMWAAGPEPPVWLLGVFNAAFRAGSCVLVYLLARRHFGEPAARVGVALYLLDPWETLWVGYVLKESLGGFLFLLAVWLLDRAASDPKPRGAFAAGIAIGIATLGRYPSGALWFAVPAVIYVASRRDPGIGLGNAARRVATGSLLVTAGMLLAMSPWLIRNWRVLGQPTLSSQFVGRYFYTSNAASRGIESSGYADAAGLDKTPLSRNAIDRGTQWEKEERLGKLALRQVLEDPGLAARRVLGKLWNMWQPTFAESSLLNRIVLGIPYCLLLALSLTGVGIAVRRRLPAAGIAAPVVVFLLIHMIFWAEIRNRQYLMPLLYCYGGLAVAHLARHVRRSPARPAGDII